MVLDGVGARLSGGMLTETLKVDPSALHVTAARLQEDVAGLARSSPASALSVAAGSMPGCATSVACSRLQGVVDAKVNALSADMSQFADRLRTAAAAYQNRDSQSARDLDFNDPGKPNPEPRRDDGTGAEEEPAPVPAPSPAPAPAPNPADIAKQFLGRDASDLKAAGELPMNPVVDSDVCCANFVTATLQKAGLINWHDDRVYEMSQKLRQQGWRVVPAKQARPGDVAVINGNQHTELVAANDNGAITLIGSNNINPDGTQKISLGKPFGDVVYLSPP